MVPVFEPDVMCKHLPLQSLSPTTQPCNHRSQRLHRFITNHKVRNAVSFTQALQLFNYLLYAANEQVRIGQHLFRCRTRSPTFSHEFFCCSPPISGDYHPAQKEIQLNRIEAVSRRLAYPFQLARDSCLCALGCIDRPIVIHFEMNANNIRLPPAIERSFLPPPPIKNGG